MSESAGQFRSAQQPAITHGVDEQDRTLPVHPANNEAVLGRFANEVEVVAIGVRGNNCAEIGFVQRLGGGEHFQNQPGLALDVRPKPAVEFPVPQPRRDFLERPEREAGPVGFGTEASKKIAFGEWAAELLRHVELPGASERGDGTGAIAQPVERIIVRVARARLVVHQAHHQVGDLRLEAVGKCWVGQIQLQSRQC